MSKTQIPSGQIGDGEVKTADIAAGAVTVSKITVDENLDFNNNQAINIRIEVLSTDPTGLMAGDQARIWFNSTDKQLKLWNGTVITILG